MFEGDRWFGGLTRFWAGLKATRLYCPAGGGRRAWQVPSTSLRTGSSTAQFADANSFAQNDGGYICRAFSPSGPSGGVDLGLAPQAGIWRALGARVDGSRGTVCHRIPHLFEMWGTRQRRRKRIPFGNDKRDEKERGGRPVCSGKYRGPSLSTRCAQDGGKDKSNRRFCPLRGSL